MRKTTRKRRWLRYSLRTVLVIVLVLSVWLAWMANRAAKQRRIVGLIEELGGTVIYERERGHETAYIDPSYSDDDIIYPPILGETYVDLRNRIAPPDGPLYSLLGVDWFHSVVGVRLSKTNVADQTITAILSGWPELKWIHLFDCPVTDAVIEPLASLDRLEIVDLRGTDVSRTGIQRLRRRRPELEVFYYGG